MEIILLQDVENIGKMGNVVKVTDGYARNYLLPRKLAMAATPAAVAVVEQRKVKQTRELEKEKAHAEAVAKKIQTLSPTIAVEAGLEDKIFGSVTQEMIRNVLRQDGVDIDKRDISIEEPIHKLGVYQIGIKLHPQVMAELRVWVVKK